MPITTIAFAATASRTSFRMSPPWLATFSRTAGWIFSSGRMLRAIALILETREEAVELVREALAVRVVERRGTAGALARAARHLQGADIRRRRRAQQLVRHQRQRDLRPLRRPVEDILDDRGTRVSVNPDVHGWGQTPILPGSRFTGV